MAKQGKDVIAYLETLLEKNTFLREDLKELLQLVYV